MCWYCDDSADEVDACVGQERMGEELAGSDRPHRVFGRLHPLGNPAEVAEFLNQEDRWVSASGPIDIADMTPEHAQNTAALILENATRIALVIQVSDPAGFYESELSNETQARRQILQSILFSALIRRAAIQPERLPSWKR